MKKISYALGMALANNLVQSGVKNLDVASFSKAVDDVLNKKTLELSENEAQIEINSYFQKMQEEAGKEAKDAGEKFLEENKKQEGVVTLPSGLQYKVIKQGTGDKPKATDQVRCHYHGTLIDGTVFDSSVRRGEPAVFPVNGVIQGWVEALQLMPVGSKWTLYIPYEMAYGTRGAGQSIPPYAALIFEVELLEIVK
jgi:FKBP-type peptidyl-prolyl cis-trans isomerase FklB